MSKTELLLFLIAVMIATILGVSIITAVNTQRVADIFYGDKLELVK